MTSTLWTDSKNTTKKCSSYFKNKTTNLGYELHVSCFYIIGSLWRQNHLRMGGHLIQPHRGLTICFVEAVIVYHSLYLRPLVLV